MTEATRVEGVVAVIRRNGRLLAIRRSENVIAPGAWCLPGGAIEPGESPADAVVREVCEEVGLPVRAEREIWRWLREDGRLALYWWLATIDEQTAQPVPNPHEVGEIRWVTPTEFSRLEPLLPSNLLFLAHCEHLLG